MPAQRRRARFFKDHIDAIRLQVVADAESGEPNGARCPRAGVFGCDAVLRQGAFSRGIEPIHAATVGRDPLPAARRLEEIVDPCVGQSLQYAVSYEALTVETAQARRAAEPQEPTRIGHDASDSNVSEAIGRRGRSQREAVRRIPFGSSRSQRRTTR